MKLAIIGSAGFIGTATGRMCASMGHHVTGYDVDPAGAGGDFACRRFDVLSEELALEPGTDCVLYLAQWPGYREHPPREDKLYGVNTEGAVKAAAVARSMGVRLFCYASTGNVYRPSYEPLSEDSPLQRGTPYARSKAMAEEALADLAGEMRVVSFRPFGVFGPGQKRMLPARLCRMVRRRQPIELAPAPADGDRPEGLRVSFCYVDDAARILIRIAELGADGAALPPAINVAGPEAISIRRFAETVGRHVGIAPTFRTTAETRPFDLIADTSRLEALVAPRFTPFSEAIANTVAGR